MSKMGISTVSSYCGAQVFEAVGLDSRLVRALLPGHPSKIGGIGLAGRARRGGRPARAGLAAENRHRSTSDRLEVGGEYQWRREGELHLFNPETVFLLQHATRSRQYDVFRQYTAKVDALAAQAGSLRGLFTLRTGVRPAVPIEEVEPATEIVKRFATGAMSYGSISAEAHETLAIAMNRLGGKSNTGEGGEDVERLHDPARRSAVKQVASGRFGVTSEYLVNADDLQIKMAQGAKPGEGGQLPGNKVWPWIARTRHATPGVGSDLPAAAPRHLLHRGPRPARARPEVRQPGGPGARQAGQRGRRRHRRGRGREAQGGRHPDLRARRRHRRLPAELAQARRHPVGAGAGRGAADAAAQQAARPGHRAGRRPAQDRPGRAWSRRCSARRSSASRPRR